MSVRWSRRVGGGSGSPTRRNGAPPGTLRHGPPCWTVSTNTISTAGTGAEQRAGNHVKKSKLLSWGRGTSAGLGVLVVAAATVVSAVPAHAVNQIEVYASEISTHAASWTGWHQDYGDGSFKVIDAGLSLVGDMGVVREFEEHPGIDELTRAAQGGISWTSTGDGARFEINVLFGEGYSTTLTPVNVSAGTKSTASAAMLWDTESMIGPMYANTFLPLGELVAAIAEQGDVQVRSFGVATTEGHGSVVSQVTWLNDSYTFHPNRQLGGAEPTTPDARATLTGDARVGSTLVVATEGWRPEDPALSYEWSYNGGAFGGPIEGVTGTSFTVTDEFVGLRIAVTVTRALPGGEPQSVRSNETDWITAPQRPAVPAPVADSAALAAFLATQGITPQPQGDAGLPGGALDPTGSHTASIVWGGRDSFVDVYAYSTPVLLGTFPVVDGRVEIVLSPAALGQLEAGSHTLLVVGQSSGAAQAVSFSVAATLAATGVSPAAPIGVAALALLLGAALVVVRRLRVTSGRDPR